MREEVSKNVRSVVNFWQSENPVFREKKHPSFNLPEIMGAIFSPGHYYFYVFNFFNHQFDYVHPTVEEIIGCKPEEFNLDFWFSVMHPEDMKQMQLKESAAAEFLFRRIPPEKIPFYKVSYTFRVKDHRGNGYRNILHQCIALELSEDGKITYTLGVHSDISFLKLAPDDRVSFIGVNGEPSYFALSTSPESFLKPTAEEEISAREREIVKLMSEGFSSKQIADQLQISVHTVDTHRRNLLKKTGAKNTLELTVACLKKGLI